jgi:lysophospholipase L1-like esterase
MGSFKKILMVALTLLATCLAAPSQAKSEQWLETFQSSPAAYGVHAPEAWAKDMASRITTVSGTLRFQLAVSTGGSQVRIRFSNESGQRSLRISAASLALTTGFDGAAADAIMPVTFRGAASVTIPPGAPMLSDPVMLPVKAGDQLLVNTYLPEGIALDSYGATGMWTAPGDQTRNRVMMDAGMIIGRPVVSGVAVLSDQAPLVVTLGDSLTAGGRKTPEELHGWPETLSKRLAGAVAIVNAGIAGNRIVSDGYGESALARLDRDVLRMEGLTWVIILEGINDIGFQDRQQFGVLQPDIQVDDVIDGYRQIIARVHARGGKVMGATLLPFEGSFYYTPAKEEMRQYVNAWIRTSGAYDAVVDFDAVMRDPDSPLNLKPAFDSGDHLHPNLLGQQVMGDAIDLKGFR